MSQGIFGIIDFKNKIEKPEDLSRKMGVFLEKDGRKQGKISYALGDHYILGMKRITTGAVHEQSEILRDLENRALCLIHGEINNFQEIIKEHESDGPGSRGDLNLIMSLYRRHGLQSVRKLNGLFSLAILDERNSSFTLICDRFGLAHQVYWTVKGSRLYFATHLKTLLMFPGVQKEIDMEGLNLFLKYSYIPSPWTILKGIKKLSPGCMLVFKDGKITTHTFWEFGTNGNPVNDLQEAISAYKGLLKKSLSRRLNSHEDVGILLSGGLDSSANVALGAECTSKGLKTFAVGFEDPAFDERPYARMVARHYNTQHFESTITGQEIEDLPKLIWHLEEPYFEFGLFLTYQGLAAAQQEVDIVIGGEGADQLFGTGGFAGGRPAALHYLLKKYHLLGLSQQAAKTFKGSYFYEHDNLAFKFRMLWDRAIDLNHWYFYGYDDHELLSLYQNPALAYIPNIFPDGGALHPTPFTLHPSFQDFYLQTQINQDLIHYVNENVMVKSGRMADMFDLTLRESYLDTGVTDFLVSMDYRLKRSGGLFDHLRGRIKTKFLHRKTVEGLLPTEIMKKPKQGGFVPVMIFLKDPALRKKIYHHLLHSKVTKEYFNAGYLNALFEKYEAVQGKEIYWHNFYNSKANRILFLLTFDIWHHFYLENKPLDVTPPPLSQYLLS